MRDAADLQSAPMPSPVTNPKFALEENYDIPTHRLTVCCSTSELLKLGGAYEI